jgi:hypothetical protein
MTPNVKLKAQTDPVEDSSRLAMESLAQELDVPLEQVERVYRAETRAVEAGARIRNFVPVIVAGRVRSSLRKQRRSS